MSAQKYYNSYKKSKKERITDAKILPRIHALLKETEDNRTRNFLLSLQVYCNQHGGLTPKQYLALSEIDKDLSEKATSNYEKWKLEYDEDKKEIAKICAHYYRANPPYYAHVVEKIISDENYIPTERQYKAMCNNKYTQKVVRETKAKPKYPPGSLVRGRKSASREVKDKIGTVIETDAAPVTSAASGAKVYSVLFFGESKVVLCEERYLKKVYKA